MPSPARGRIKWSSAIPLALFLAIYGSACLYIEIEKPLIFTRPEWFFLVILSPWFWWQFATGMSGLRGWRAFLAQLVRLTLFGLIIMVLAEPRAVRKTDALNVMYVVDISDSMGGDGVTEAVKFVERTAQERPASDKAGLIVFARNAAVELPPRTTFPMESINSVVGKDATNIAKGLSLAKAMLPNDENARIVLVSDGTANEGHLKEVLDNLRSKRIPVDVFPIEYDFKNEVWLERLDLPTHVQKGETYEAGVLLSSISSGGGVLTLEENGATIFSDRVTYKSGKNRLSIPLKMREPGYYEYVARISPDNGRDGWKKNNIAIGGIYLRGEGKTLLVKDSYGDERDWKILFEALRRVDFIVEVKDAIDFPRNSMALMPYDCVIFDNVPADAFDYAQMNALKMAVENQGAGFLMVGGKNAFGPGGYNRTPIEKILPVKMDITNKKVLPKAALAIILHTCEFRDGNTWAKRIAKAAIRVLGAQDEVGLLAYDYQGGEKWIFPLTPAEKYAELAKKINRAEPGDMPSFATTMKMGLQGLTASNAATKHMIIISDGDPDPPPPALLNKFKAAKITISTVLVDGFHQGSFQRSMRSIAGSTGGRFYYPKNPNLLPRIFVKEAKTLKRSMIQNKTFVPKVEFDDGTLLKGVNALPPLHGYVLTSAKDDPRRCRVILRGPDKDQLDPVLAIGQFGIGKTSAFTSDLSPNWAKDWLEWNKFLPFLKQLMISISRVSKEGTLRMRTFASGNNAWVVVEDFKPRPGFLTVAAMVAGPNNKKIEIKLKQDGPGRYKTSFPLWGKGRYEVMAVASGDDRQERVNSSFAVPYSAEYLRFRSNPKLLKEIVKRTHGRMLASSISGVDIFTRERETRRTSKPIFDLFLLLIACCVPLDVALRRIQIDFTALTSIFKRKRDGADSSETLGALLKRKESVGSKMKDEENKEKPLRQTLDTTKATPKTAPKPKTTPTPKSSAETAEGKDKKRKGKQEDEEATYTTSRLLAAKKRKKQDDE